MVPLVPLKSDHADDMFLRHDAFGQCIFDLWRADGGAHVEGRESNLVPKRKERLDGGDGTRLGSQSA